MLGAVPCFAVSNTTPIAVSSLSSYPIIGPILPWRHFWESQRFDDRLAFCTGSGQFSAVSNTISFANLSLNSSCVPGPITGHVPYSELEQSFGIASSQSRAPSQPERRPERIKHLSTPLTQNNTPYVHIRSYSRSTQGFVLRDIDFSSGSCTYPPEPSANHKSASAFVHYPSRKQSKARRQRLTLSTRSQCKAYRRRGLITITQS